MIKEKKGRKRRIRWSNMSSHMRQNTDKTNLINKKKNDMRRIQTCGEEPRVNTRRLLN